MPHKRLIVACDGTWVIVYYQAGLGSANNWYSYYVGGYLGQGIGENIREAYAFLCDNHEPGDEIFLLGFSRGAFTGLALQRGCSADIDRAMIAVSA